MRGVRERGHAHRDVPGLTTRERSETISDGCERSARLLSPRERERAVGEEEHARAEEAREEKPHVQCADHLAHSGSSRISSWRMFGLCGPFCSFRCFGASFGCSTDQLTFVRVWYSTRVCKLKLVTPTVCLWVVSSRHNGRDGDIYTGAYHHPGAVVFVLSAGLFQRTVDATKKPSPTHIEGAHDSRCPCSVAPLSG